MPFGQSIYRQEKGYEGQLGATQSDLIVVGTFDELIAGDSKNDDLPYIPFGRLVGFPAFGGKPGEVVLTAASVDYIGISVWTNNLEVIDQLKDSRKSGYKLKRPVTVLCRGIIYIRNYDPSANMVPGGPLYYDTDNVFEQGSFRATSSGTTVLLPSQQAKILETIMPGEIGAVYFDIKSER